MTSNQGAQLGISSGTVLGSHKCAPLPEMPVAGKTHGPGLQLTYEQRAICEKTDAAQPVLWAGLSVGRRQHGAPRLGDGLGITVPAC